MLECQLSKASIRYESIGEGIPLLVIHGFSCDHHYIQNDLEPLFVERAGWQRIYIDLPGHGQSKWPAWISNEDQILDLLCEFINQVLPEKRFVLVGESWGGAFSLGIINRLGDLVDGLYLTVPYINLEGGEESLPEHSVLVENPAFMDHLQAEDPDWAPDFLVVQDPGFIDRLREDIYKVAKENEKQDLKWENIFYSLSNDPSKVFFNKPSLILTGRQDSVVGYQKAFELIENFPRGTFAVLDRGGHYLSLEQQNLMHNLVNEWLDRVEESRGDKI
ncbi:MAG: alpha/beta hydrolase [Anaerolineales bacterium]